MLGLVSDTVGATCTTVTETGADIVDAPLLSKALAVSTYVPAWRPLSFTVNGAAGFAHVHDFAELGNFEQQAGHVVKQAGPVFATLRVEPSKPLTYDYPDLYDPRRRQALKAALR